MNHTEEPDQNWPALRRTGVLNSILDKHVRFIALADRRAQVMLALYAFLIPLSLAGTKNPTWFPALIIFLVFALASACCAFLSLLPKRYNAVQECDCQMLHFSGICRFSESDYMERMQAMLNDEERLAAAVTRDIYHISRDILKPKFRWMRISYLLFFVGSTLSILTILFSLI
jgi:hypothetical protein